MWSNLLERRQQHELEFLSTFLRNYDPCLAGKQQRIFSFNILVCKKELSMMQSLYFTLIKDMADRSLITIETTVEASPEKVWRSWTEPEHIMKWNNASDDWHTTRSTNDVREGGMFTSRMEAKDGSAGFDFAGTYTEVTPLKSLAYTMEDGRAVSVTFEDRSGKTHISETFAAELENPLEMQRLGWLAILDNFKKYTQSLA